MATLLSNNAGVGHLSVVEVLGPKSSNVTRAAVSFAGFLAAETGCRVERVVPGESDPIRYWPPGETDPRPLHQFLNSAKRPIASIDQSNADILLTDDPDCFQRWPSANAVFLCPTRCRDRETAHPHGELTLMARAGLLDIFPGKGGRPKPLPGNQLAYAAGMAAFNALMAQTFASMQGRSCEPATVAVLDVALWINWKHYLSSLEGTTSAGLDRIEEWVTLPCKDGFIALIFQDKDMPALAELTGSEFFLGADVATRSARQAHVGTIHGKLRTWMAERTRAEVIADAQTLRIPFGPVLTLDEVLDDRHLNFREFFRMCAANRRLPRLPVLWNGQRLEAGGDEITASKCQDPDGADR